MKKTLLLFISFVLLTCDSNNEELSTHIDFLEKYLTPERASGFAYRPPFFDWAVKNLQFTPDGSILNSWKPGFHCTVTPDDTMYILEINRNKDLIPHKILPINRSENKDVVDSLTLRQYEFYIYFQKDVSTKGKLKALNKLKEAKYQKISIVSILDTNFSVNKALNPEIVQYILNKLKESNKRDSLAAKLTFALMDDCDELKIDIQKAFHAEFDSIGLNVVKVLRKYQQMNYCNIRKTVNVIYAIALPRLEFTMKTMDVEEGIKRLNEKSDL